MIDLEVLLVCGHCGNKANCKVRAEYTQDLVSRDDDHYVTTWRILECPSCNHLILEETYDESAYYEKDTKILYPVARTRLRNLPVVIQEEYEATLKVRNISSNACAVLARRTLEAIFTLENAVGNSLMEKVNDLLKSKSIPPLLADVAHLGRKIGNLGAHFDKDEVTEVEISAMLDFLEIILQYLYVIPARVVEVKERLARDF